VDENAVAEAELVHRVGEVEDVAVGVVVSAGFGLILGLSAEASAEKGIDVTMPAPHVASQALILTQLTVAVLATLAVTSEYASGSIRSTLQSVPVRGRMLVAKSAVVVAVVAVAAGAITTIIMILLALPQLMLVVGAQWLTTATDYMPGVAGSVLLTHRCC
jgi:ABC-2 type transport system permease protein